MTFLICAALSWLAFVYATPPVRRADSKIAAAWYAGWHSDGQASPDFPLSEVPWQKYTHLTYAFAETSPDVHQLSVEKSNPGLIPNFVSEAHAHGVKALISVGGWTGSLYFSSAVATAENRTAFIKTLTSFADTYGFDGIDFDWEYPANQGIGCNTIQDNDTANFLALLQELRKTEAGSKLLLSAATATVPFPDQYGDPSNVSAFAAVLDWIAIMNYDINGQWNAAGVVAPNAPLKDTCQPDEYRSTSATTAVQAWTDAGFPAEKLVLGVPAYGHGYKVHKENAFAAGSSELKLYPQFDTSSHPEGDAWDDTPAVNACGDQENQAGVFNFWGLVATGFLTEGGEPASGIAAIYDSCTQTPFVYNSTSEVMVSYDNVASSLAKGRFVNDNGLAGFATWEAGSDYKDLLLDALREGAGFTSA